MAKKKPAKEEAPPKHVRTLGDLFKTHPEYNADKLAQQEALYEGGDKFKALVEKFLIKRQLEKNCTAPQQLNLKVEDPSAHAAVAAKFSGSKLSPGAEQWKARKERAHYIPHVAGLIDWLVAACFYCEPKIAANSSDPDTVAYWNGLNEDADGDGTDLSALLRQAELNCMLHQRGFITVFKGDSDAEDDLKIDFLSAADVDDWEKRKKNYSWIRTHKVSFERETYDGPLMEVHLWTYIMEDQIIEYRKSWPKGKQPKDEEIVTGTSKPHGMGTLPAVPVEFPKGLHVMERVKPIIVAMFNRRTSLTWSLDQTAYAMLSLFTDKPLTEVVAPEMAALKLGPQDRAEFTQPNAGIFDPQFKDLEVLKEELYEVLQAMALVSASQTQNARQAAEAKQLDKEPLAALLLSFCFPLRDALQKVVKIIKAFREEEDVQTTLTGMDRFDTKTLAQKLADVLALFKVPGVPDSAKRWAVKDACMSAAANAPAEVQQKIEVELESSKVPIEPTPEPKLQPAV